MARILLVEDDDVLRDAYQIILGTQPHTLDMARHGKEALALCGEHVYDLILLDLMMPVMDGVGFLRHFPEVGVPLPKVLLLSNLSSGKELQEALTLGAARSLLKANLSPRQLLTAVSTELGKARF